MIDIMQPRMAVRDSLVAAIYQWMTGESRIMKKEFVVLVQWDEEAGVYVATSDDLVGLVVEAPAVDKVIEKINQVLPDLVEGNGFDIKSGDVMKLVVESALPELHAA